MLASQLVTRLQKAIDDNGDLEICSEENNILVDSIVYQTECSSNEPRRYLIILSKKRGPM